MDHRDRIITWLAKRDGEAIARKVQRDLQHMTEGMQSGDDSGLANLWDEVCVQMQGQESVMWELYTDIMTTMILTHVRSLTVEQQEAIWLQTDEGSSWRFDVDWERENKASGDSFIDGWKVGFNAAKTVVEKRAAESQADFPAVAGPLEETLHEFIRETMSTSASEEGDSSQDGNATDSDDEIASYIMREYLLNLAVNWKNRRIERFLYEGRDLD